MEQEQLEQHIIDSITSGEMTIEYFDNQPMIICYSINCINCKFMVPTCANIRINIPQSIKSKFPWMFV